MNAASTPAGAERAVVWHDAECGAYRADLPLWRSLATGVAGPVLDLGCGTGRVALDLAREGHRVTAIDTDPALVSELRSRAGASGLPVDVEVADVRSLRLEGRFALAVAPMQLLQLLAGPEERARALRAVREHLAPGGVAAISLVVDVPPPADGGLPLPDVREQDGWVYSSQPVWVGREGSHLVVRRLRQTVAPDGALEDEHDEVRLAVLSADEAEAEATDCGFRCAARHSVPATADHVGSTVLELEAV